jgi:hypothetical protein
LIADNRACNTLDVAFPNRILLGRNDDIDASFRWFFSAREKHESGC